MNAFHLIIDIYSFIVCSVQKTYFKKTWRNYLTYAGKRRKTLGKKIILRTIIVLNR